jgi:hypothetical protein
MSGIGPVEPVGSSPAEETREVIGTDSPRLSDRWRALRRPVRRGLVLGAIALAATGVGLAASRTAPHERAAAVPAAPTPFPANVTQWRYLGPASAPAPHATRGSFRFAVDVGGGPPVTLEVTGAEFAGLGARATPEPRFTVRAGTTREITVEISVSDCSAVSANVDFPFLDVTLRNTRAIQRHSYIFGGSLSRDLSGLVRGACERSGPRKIPSPTGSAGSQNVD